MVATTILQQERADALDRLTHTLAGLAGTDAEAVEQTAERAAGSGAGQMGQDYLVAQYLEQIAGVLREQQERIEALESRSASEASPAKRKK